MRGYVGRLVVCAGACAVWLLAQGAPGLTAQGQPGAGRQGAPQAPDGPPGDAARGGPPAPQVPQSPQAQAPTDFTGTWVSVITEDWRWRMATPPVGDTSSVPLNPAGMKAAAAWDYKKDIAAGEQCKPFGVGGIMSMPIRLRISWQDDKTLKMEIDNGIQTRLFHFDRTVRPSAKPEWQGFSLAAWETDNEGQGERPRQFGPPRRGGPPRLSGGLKVVTTRMRAGYLRRNGVPYSANAALTEFYDITRETNGDQWLILTSSLDDPMYLVGSYFVTRQFKKEPDASKFRPRPCEMTPPVSNAPPPPLF